MATIQNFTYTELVALLPNYLERKDDAFLAQIPTFIALAENRMATDMKQQGFQSVVAGQLPLTLTMQKPAWWRETISFSYKDATGKNKPLFLRSLEFVKAYWPDSSVQDEPVYYADYNIANFLIAPTPVAARAFELAYYARLQPLSVDTQVNWLTLNAPQALLYSCLLEASLWLKNTEGAAKWEAQYNNAKTGLVSENQERLADRTTVVTRG